MNIQLPASKIWQLLQSGEKAAKEKANAANWQLASENKLPVKIGISSEFNEL